MANRRWLSSDSARGVAITPLSKKERTALRAARRERATQVIAEAKGETASASSSSSSSPSSINAKYIWYASVFVPSALLVWGFSDPNSPPAKLCDLLGITGLVSSYTDEIAKPSHDKLLPDWSQMPNVPHDIPVPHTLVLDLENTLVSSTWDRKYGWRHAKRPGVDKFLLDLAQYYEIVLYSPSIDAIADPVVTSLDKQGCIMHRLYRDATYYTGGVHVKDLNRLNRNVNRMIVIDDDPAEVQFNPENVIRVKPYTDPSDRTDNTLARITPFLIEIARENYSNIPELLSQYEGMDADGIADEQERRIQYYRDVRETEMSRGLGGLAKMARKQVNFEPDMTPQDINLKAGGGNGAPQQLSAKDIVGAAPSTSSDEKSGLVGFLSRREEEKAESTRRKFEKWNEVMMRKAQEKEAKAR
eukprot:CAMPEP_0113498192 /NCGR_PEP_ID=MMETSP0014_2-20120614/31026_1 /TAXON_ID=2857 /ORGANISM="Nitzschia sp." /LENGTH=415 /DNA_ID=CAMNT_0000392169 /DNA_START=171 /DNA_END=1414 /DNA_ORIENTATION=+ /assembly_acc=CAM_ASM_000159